MSRALAAVVAAVLYLGVTLWTLRAIVPAPASTFPYPTYVDTAAPRWTSFMRSDQKLTAALIAHNAAVLVRAPWRLMEGNQCFPVPNATTLGEPMIGPSLRAMLPYALTRDPILTYNVVVAVSYWGAALAMYALVIFWTGSAGAALVAGLIFGFHPLRITDPAHLYVFGNLWTPLALLFAHQLFARRRWLDAAGLAVFVGLQLVESAYPALALVLLGGTYGLFLIGRNLRTMVALLPKLAACMAVWVGLAAMVMVPYLEARATWPTVGGRGKVLYDLSRYTWGQPGFPGGLALLLTIVALLDRVRRSRARRGYDPRVILLLAGLLVAWTAVREIAIPALGVRVPSLFAFLAALVPSLDMLRVGGAVESGLSVVVAFLAGYGLLVLLERARPRARHVLTAVVAAGVLVEIFYTPLARASFGRSAELTAYRVRPPAALLESYAKLPPGAVLDLPLDPGPAGFWYLGDEVFLGAFHGRPVAACYNSFQTPVQPEIAALAKRVLDDAGAADALRALGFGSVVVHFAVPGRRQPPPIVPWPLPEHLVLLARMPTHAVYGLRSDAPVDASFAPLAVATPTATDAVPGAASLAVTFRNRSGSLYRHPDPIVPTTLRARWSDTSGSIVAEHDVTTLLPLALAPGEAATRSIDVPVPSTPASYRLTLSPASRSDLLIADVSVRVTVPLGSAEASR